MNRIRHLLNKLSPVKEASDKAFVEQEAQYQTEKVKREQEQAELLRESRERQRELLKRP